MNHLTIATRLKIMAVLPLAILLGISLLAWAGLRTDGAALTTLRADSEMSRLIGTIGTDMYRMRMSLANAMIAEEPPETARLVKSVEDGMHEIMRNWTTYRDHGLSNDERQVVEVAYKDMDRMLNTTVHTALAALRRGDREAAKTIVTDQASRDLSETVREHLDRLQALENAGGKVLYDQFVDRSTMLTYGMTGAFLIAALVLGWFSLTTSRAIRRPVEAMRVALVEAQRGSDLTQRVAVRGKDEVSEMARAFNALMASLQETLNRVSANAQQVSTAATQMAAASTQITESSRVQSESAASTAAAVEEVTVSINQVADNTRETRSVSEQACVLSTQGEKSARMAAEQMLDTAQSVGLSMELIERLSQRSKDISGIVKVIRDIAEQTNLLALNAAIEAARAGEQGRGFAVVADEVRKLAERTATSTSEISGMIESIQGVVGRAVENLKSNNAQVAQGKSLAEEVAATLARINEGARITMERINDISSAASEQGTASNDIARNVEKIAQMTEENSAAISQASTTARELEALASRLHSDVAQFKTV